MNKQIEEMADILCSAKEHNCNGGNDCLCIKQATALYNEGYKQEKEVAQKIFQELKEWCHYVYHDGQEGEMVFFSHVIDIVKKFGVEVK